MPRIDELYSALNQQGLYTKSLDDFKNQFSTPEAVNQLHFALKQEGLYTKSLSDFNNQFFSDQLKKKEEALPSTPSAEGGLLGTTPMPQDQPLASFGEVMPSEAEQSPIFQQYQAQKAQQPQATEYVSFEQKPQVGLFGEELPEPQLSDEEIIRSYLPANYDKMSIGSKMQAMAEALKNPEVLKIVETERERQEISPMSIESSWLDAANKFNATAADITAGVLDIPWTVYKSLQMTGLGGLSQDQINRINKLPEDQQDKAMAIELGVTTEGGGGDIASYYYSLGDIAERFRSYAKSQRDKTAQFETSIQQDIANGNISQATFRTVTEAIGSVPYTLAAMTLAPQAGAGAISSYFQPASILGLGTVTAVNKIDQELKDGQKISPELLATATIHGLAEGVLEGAGSAAMNRLAKAAIGNSVVAKQVAENAAGEFISAVGLEGTTEGLTSVIQEGADALVLGKPMNLQQFSERVFDAALIGAFSGGGMAAPSVGITAYKEKVKPYLMVNSMTQDATKWLRESDQKINQLKRGISQSTDPSEIAALSYAMRSIVLEKEKVLQGASDFVDNMTNQDIVEMIDIKSQLDKSLSEAEAIKSSQTMDDETKKIALDNLKSKAISLINKRQDLVKRVKENAVQKQTTSEVPVQPEARVGEEVAQGAPEAKPEVVTEEVVQEEVVPEKTIEEKRTETEKKIQNKMFFPVGSFSRTLGKSDVDAVPTNHSVTNGIETVEYSNPNTGSVDVVVSAVDGKNYVGYYRIYENGQPTNKWSSKLENQSRNKENLKTMLSSAQTMLPEGHEYTEKTSISTDGLRVWGQQLDKGYELQYDDNGNVITNTVSINGDAIVNELGIPVEKGKFKAVKVTTTEQFETAKKAILPYLERFGLGEKNVRAENGTIKIDLPVLKKSEVVTEEGVKKEVTPEIYVQELKRTKSSDPAQYWTVDSVDLEAAKDGTIVSVDGGYGVVSKEGDIKGVFKTPETTRKGVADDILKKAVEAGGIKLDNFDNYLTPIYKRNGFKIVSRLPFSEEAAPSDWTKAQGTPDVVAMVYDPDNKLNIEEKTFEDYDEAMAYRDSYVEQAKQAYQAAAPVDQATVGQTIQNTAKALQVAFPGVEFIVGENLEDTRARIVEALTPRVGMEKAQEVANDFKDVRGQALFSDEKPVAIVIDKAAANTRTAGHEAWEVMLNDAFGKNPEKFAEFRNSIDRQLRLAGYNDIATELQKFSEQYAKEGNEVVFREYMAEFGGMLTEGGFDIKNLTPQQKSLLQKIKDIINDFAMQLTGKEVFLKDATAENIIDFMSTISQKVAKGETVEEFFETKDTTEIENTDTVFKNRSQKIGDFDIYYFEDEAEFQKLVDDGLVVQNASIDEAAGEPVAVHQPDNLFVGNLSYKGKKIMDGNGGVYYVLKFGNVWASGAKTSASSLVKLINESRAKSSDKKARLVLVRGSQDKMISSVQGVKAAMQILEELVFSGLISTSDFRTALKAAGKKYNIDFAGTASASSIKADIESKFMNVSDSTFEKRGTFFSDLVDELGKLESPKKNIKEIQKAIGAKKNIRFTKQGIREQLGTIMTERLLLGLPSSHAYAMIEVDEDVTFKEDKEHPSYPYAIVTKSGKPPVLKIFGYRPKAVEAIRRIDGSPASNAQLGLAQRGMGIGRVATEAKITSRAQKINYKDIPGYDRMRNEVDGIIEKATKRGATKARIAEDVINYVQKSAVYEKANDSQREQMIRDLKKEFGQKLKSAPRVERVLGIKPEEKELITNTQMIAERAKAVKYAEKSMQSVLDQIGKEVMQMKQKGKITSAQMRAIINRASKVKLVDDKSVRSFIEYVDRIMNNAEYAEKGLLLNKKLANAKRNAARKIGIADGLSPLLQKLFSINSFVVPKEVFNDYAELVEMFADRSTVLTLGDIDIVTAKAKKILDSVEGEMARADALSEVFDNYENKVTDKAGNLMYAETINQMVEDGSISPEDGEIMKKYKSLIVERTKKDPRSEEEIEEERLELVDAVKSYTPIYSQLPSLDERNLARSIYELIKSGAVDKMNNKDLKDLLKVLDNIENGFLPHYAQILKEKMNQINNGESLAQAASKAKLLTMEKITSRIKTIFSKDKSAYAKAIQRNPLFFIDEVFGNFNSRPIFNAVFKPVSQAYSKYQGEINTIMGDLNEALANVARSYGNNPNKTQFAKQKLMAYMLQREFQSNIGQKDVNSAKAFLDETIAFAEDNEQNTYSKKDIENLKEIRDNFFNSEEVDLDSVYETFNKAEKKAIDVITKINDSMSDKVAFTSAIIRGRKVGSINKYVHHNVLMDKATIDDVTNLSIADMFNSSMKPSTKAKSLEERTGKVTPLVFDPFSSTVRGAKYLLMDYHLTEPIRTARRTLNYAKANSKGEAKKIVNAISKSLEQTLSNVLTNSYTENNFMDEVVSYIEKTGYRAMLGSIPRAVSELTSNLAYVALYDPKSYTAGLGYSDITMSSDGLNVMRNSGSQQIERLYPSSKLSGRILDKETMSQASGIKAGRSLNDVANVSSIIYNNSLKKVKNVAETTSDYLISTPDKAVMKPLWFGAYASEFKRITGRDVDFNKIAAGDEVYLTKNKEAIQKSSDYADETSVRVGASDNPFTGILKGANTANKSTMVNIFNKFNNFMTRFLIYEYSTARTGVYALMGEGKLTRRQGAAILGATMSRMIVYSFLSTQLVNLMMSALFGPDEEDDDTLLQSVSQSAASAFTGMILGRNFGNIAKAPINYAIEEFNKAFLDDMRTGEYDPYKDAIQYTIIPKESRKRGSVLEWAKSFSGAFSPMISTIARTTEVAAKTDLKSEEARERRAKELMTRTPLEIMGNLGYVPLYKDVRRIVMEMLYNDLRNGKKSGSQPGGVIEGEIIQAK